MDKVGHSGQNSAQSREGKKSLLMDGRKQLCGGDRVIERGGCRGTSRDPRAAGVTDR